MHTGSLINNVRIMLKTVEELEIYQKYTARFPLSVHMEKYVEQRNWLNGSQIIQSI